jgi:hypothetical protein
MPKKNYKKIITELFRTYNPDKISEVDALLRKFAGREEELIEKIKLKYASPAVGAHKRTRLVRLLFFLILTGIVAVAVWWTVGKGLFGGRQEASSMVEKQELTDPQAAQRERMAVEEELREMPPSAPPIEYGVQVGLFSSARNAQILDRLGDRQLDLNVLPTEDGNYMYIVGNDLELDVARRRRDEMRANGFPDAFVVGLRKGKRVEIQAEED